MEKDHYLKKKREDSQGFTRIGDAVVYENDIYTLTFTS